MSKREWNWWYLCVRRLCLCSQLHLFYMHCRNAFWESLFGFDMSTQKPKRPKCNRLNCHFPNYVILDGERRWDMYESLTDPELNMNKQELWPCFISSWLQITRYHCSPSAVSVTTVVLITFEIINNVVENKDILWILLLESAKVAVCSFLFFSFWVYIQLYFHSK